MESLRYRPVSISPLADLLVGSARRVPDNEALVFPAERVTSGGLLARAAGVARSLHALGVRHGDRVGILMPNCPAFVDSLFGTSLLGAVAVLVNARYRVDELAYVIRNAQLTVLLTSDLISDRVDFARLLWAALPGLDDAPSPASLDLPSVPYLRACVLRGAAAPAGFLADAAFAALGERVDAGVVDHAASAVAIRDDAILMYTSGTTAQPKGCRLSHEAVVRTAAAIVDRYEITDRDVWWCPLPLFHMSGILPLAATFLADSRFACMTDFDPGEALRQIREERATIHFGIFPTVNQMLLDHPDRRSTDLSSIRLINVNGSATLTAALADAHPNATVVRAYGCTELGGILTLTDPAQPGDEHTVSSGPPWPGMEVRIVDPGTGLQLPTGTRGEIVARGWGMFSGYHDDPTLTAQSVDLDSWFHTGDSGSLDELGRLTFHGRLKDMLKVGGENIAALELEEFLATHPAVALAQVVGIPDDHLDEVPAAFIERRPDHDADEAELIAYCRGRIASYKIPRHIRFVDEWPMSATKIQKLKLRAELIRELGLSE